MPASDRDVGTYIGRAACGCIQAARVDTPEHRADVSRDVAEMIECGLIVERVTVGYVRDHGFGSCEQCKQPEQQSLLESGA